MRDNKLHTPVGVRDVLCEECAIKTDITEKIRENFRCYGYQQVESP
ncbi:MAG: ATP phosphoribosyltransferase regulatory subunit, partial [Epulopiscium sp.]|nr:ATP phosphoribosyltransferase regulatory subunit [Candidatus Epulonipiscium sp.]